MAEYIYRPHGDNTKLFAALVNFFQRHYPKQMDIVLKIGAGKFWPCIKMLGPDDFYFTVSNVFDVKLKQVNTFVQFNFHDDLAIGALGTIHFSPRAKIQFISENRIEIVENEEKKIIQVKWPKRK